MACFVEFIGISLISSSVLPLSRFLQLAILVAAVPGRHVVMSTVRSKSSLSLRISPLVRCRPRDVNVYTSGSLVSQPDIHKYRETT